MHAHTSPASICSQVSPKEMAETYKNLGYDAIVITNHFIYNPNKNYEGVSALRLRCLPKDSFDLAKQLKQGEYILEIGRNNIVIP